MEIQPLNQLKGSKKRDRKAKGAANEPPPPKVAAGGADEAAPLGLEAPAAQGAHLQRGGARGVVVGPRSDWAPGSQWIRVGVGWAWLGGLGWVGVGGGWVSWGWGGVGSIYL